MTLLTEHWEAVAIVPYVKEVVENFEGKVFFTRDTHFENYMETQEGKNIPVPHCIQWTEGWQIRAELEKLRKTEAIDKLTFGSKDLVEVLKEVENIEEIQETEKEFKPLGGTISYEMGEITFVGLCTDICVISNVMVVKAFYPEIPLVVDAKGCAGVTVQSHLNALEAMKMCQVKVINE